MAYSITSRTWITSCVMATSVSERTTNHCRNSQDKPPRYRIDFDQTAANKNRASSRSRRAELLRPALPARSRATASRTTRVTPNARPTSTCCASFARACWITCAGIVRSRQSATRPSNASAERARGSVAPATGLTDGPDSRRARRLPCPDQAGTAGH